MPAPPPMDFSPFTAAWDYFYGPTAPQRVDYPELERNLPAPTPAERQAAMPKTMPFNPSLDEQNFQQPNVQRPALLDAMLRGGGSTPPKNSTDGAIAPWVNAGGSAADFYDPDAGPAKPLQGMPIGPPKMMAPTMREALRSQSNPWTALGGSESDFYDPDSAREQARQQTIGQLAKIRQVNAMYAPPSQSAIEQTMQNQAMGYAPEYQRAYLNDMATRSQTRLQAAAHAMNDLFGQDVGFRNADVQSQGNILNANKADQELRAQLGVEMMKNDYGLPPEIIQRLRDMLLMRVLVGGR